jgi:hypothetical protein
VADAPKGFIIKNVGSHMVRVPYGKGYGTKEQAEKSILDDIDEGTEPCPEKNCDVCNEA